MDITEKTQLTPKNGWKFALSLTNKEIKELYKWFDEHSQICTGQFYSTFISGASGIGSNLVVRCKRCNQGKDITDYSIW